MQFLVLIALLSLLALVFVLVPLLKKSSLPQVDRQQANLESTRLKITDLENELNNDLISADQFESIREEAENTLVLEMANAPSQTNQGKSNRFYRFTAAGLTLFVPAFALLVYLFVGTPTALLPTAGQELEQQTDQSLEQIIGKLEQRLAENPGDQQGWLVLAQTNMMMQKYPQAVAAMEKLYQLTGDTADVLARYADALTMANGGRFNEQSKAMIDRALELDPNHLHALWLAGVVAYQDERFDTAVQLFEKARANTDDAENLAQIEDLLNAARQKSKDGEQKQAPASLEVSVEVSAPLKEKVQPGQTLFVFARAAEGPPMPLAVSKHKAEELPLTLTLDDSMAMLPSMKLSSFNQVVVSARISNSDQPLAQTGDLQGESTVINPAHTEQVSIIISRIVE